MVAVRQQRSVAEALGRLATALEDLEFGVAAPAQSAARDRLAGSIRSYLIPKILDPLAPLTVVLAGPTGSGKSTIINSLSGLDVSTTGAVRPTTRAPVVLARPQLAERYEQIGGVDCQVVTGEAPILDSIVLVDAPDLDSTATGHRAMTETLIDNADVVVFITSALRYADEVPWQVLRRAVSRGTPLVQVLNRVGSASAGAAVDFRSRLSAAGLDDDVVTVPEHHLASSAQRVPSLAIRSLRKKLGRVVANRHEFSGQVFGRVLRSTLRQVNDLARVITDIDDEIDELETEIAVYLLDRASELDLTGVADEVYPPLAGEPSRREIHRWRKSLGSVEPGSIETAESKVVTGLLSLIESDLRHWLVDERSLLREWNVDSHAIATTVIGDAHSSVEGWVDYAARIAADQDRTDPWPGEAVLLHGALTGAMNGTAVSAMFGEEGDVLVLRARRELEGRLEVIYRQAGEAVVQAVRHRYGDLDDEELIDALRAVTTSLSPLDA